MRKNLNKKGFSLTELIIVVVVMGILAGISVPLYKAVTKNTHNETCDTSIEAIKKSASNYYAYFKKPIDLDGLKEMMEDEETIPSCPLGGTYTIGINEDTGRATVQCHNCDEDHTPTGSETIFDDNGVQIDTSVTIIQTGASA